MDSFVRDLLSFIREIAIFSIGVVALVALAAFIAQLTL